MTEIFLDERAEWRPFVPSTDVRVMNGIVARWLPEPDYFDKVQKPLADYRREFPWSGAEGPAGPAMSLARRLVFGLRPR